MFYKPISCLLSSFVNLSDLHSMMSTKNLYSYFFVAHFWWETINSDQKKIEKYTIFLLLSSSEELRGWQMSLKSIIISSDQFISENWCKKIRLLSFFPMNLIIESLGLC